VRGLRRRCGRRVYVIPTNAWRSVVALRGSSRLKIILHTPQASPQTQRVRTCPGSGPGSSSRPRGPLCQPTRDLCCTPRERRAGSAPFFPAGGRGRRDQEPAPALVHFAAPRGGAATFEDARDGQSLHPRVRSSESKKLSLSTGSRRSHPLVPPPFAPSTTGPVSPVVPVVVALSWASLLPRGPPGWPSSSFFSSTSRATHAWRGIRTTRLVPASRERARQRQRARARPRAHTLSLPPPLRLISTDRGPPPARGRVRPPLPGPPRRCRRHSLWPRRGPWPPRRLPPLRQPLLFGRSDRGRVGAPRPRAYSRSSGSSRRAFRGCLRAGPDARPGRRPRRRRRRHQRVRVSARGWVPAGGAPVGAGAGGGGAGGEHGLTERERERERDR